MKAGGDWTRRQGALVGVAVGAWILSTAYMAASGGQIDWVTYANAVSRVAAGLPLYADAQLHGAYQLNDMVMSGYAYPPVSLILMAPFASPEIGRVAWLSLGILTFTGGMLAVTRRYHGLRNPYLVALLFVTLAFSGPYTEAVYTGNSSLLLAGFFALSVAYPRRWAGWTSAVGGLIRITPGAGLMLSWRANGRRQVVVVVAASVAILVLTIPVFGLETWRDYVASLAGAVPSCDRLVNSPTCYLMPITGLSLAKVVVVGAAGILLMGALRIRSDLLAALLVSVAIVIPLPDLWPHYLLFPIAALWAVLAARLAGLKLRTQGSTLATRADLPGRALG
jgi:hypothetical protein